jgi:hypothetical protein
MFTLVATALAGAALGWPCQRLNWAWRNVWTTCSINSFTPLTTAETPATIPNQFRMTGATPVTPTAVLAGTGVFTPVAANAVPTLLCGFAPATGSGPTATLRNRCRRAIDSYGGLVKICGAPQGLYPNRLAVPGLASPDFQPQQGHQPHVSNVQGLTHNAQMCLLPAGAYGPGALASPQTTCPGLLGWFTVVFNACGFSLSPSMSPSMLPNAPSAVAPSVNAIFPLGNTINSAAVLVNPVSPTLGAGYFCTTNAPSIGTPTGWNAAGATFRTSRCRKALDQFGRTANRCAISSASIAAGPAQAGGYSDPLRILAVGAAGVVPLGFNSFTPACN